MRNISALAATALIAAISSVICARLQIPVWIMFIGWIAFVAGGASAATAAPTFASSLLGALLGSVGALIIAGGSPGLGDLALLVGVFVIVFVALLAQYLPVISSVICYFIGMTTFFASGMPPALSTWTVIGAGLLIGVGSGLLATVLSARIASPRSASS